MTKKEIEIQLALGSLTNNMKIALAGNPDTPKEVLIKLSTDNYWYVRYRVAYNPNTPKEVLTKLSTNEYWIIRSCVADNPNTPKEVLTKLSIDEDSIVRRKAARKPQKTEINNSSTFFK